MNELSTEAPVTQWARVLQNEKFTCLKPLSGYWRALQEDDVPVIYLEPSPSDDILGRTLLESLDKSRFFDLQRPREPRPPVNFFDNGRAAKLHQQWHEELMARFDYKTKQDAYQNMTYCRVTRRNGQISITPHNRDKPEYWRALPDKTVIIPETRDPAIVGAALKLGLSRCG